MQHILSIGPAAKIEYNTNSNKKHSGQPRRDSRTEWLSRLGWHVSNRNKYKEGLGQRMMDFSLAMYSELCKAIQPRVVTVEQYLSGTPERPCIVLRHDVDRNAPCALAMAELEHAYGIKSTYYFRYPKTFDTEIVKRIYDLGHEVGYHYEVLDKSKGDFPKAIDLFQKELAIFRRSFRVRSVAMHGNPLTKWDGRDLWRQYDLRSFGIVGEAFLSFDNFPVYLTDTGRNWNGDNNFKDRLSGAPQGNFKNTADVIRFIKSCGDTDIYISCHPERWVQGFMGWSAAFLRDHFFNLCKRAIRAWRTTSKGRTAS